MSLIQRLLFISILTILIGSVSAQQMVDAIAAVVGKEIILKSEIEQLIYSYEVQNKINVRSKPAEFEKLQKELLSRLVEQKILLTKAEEDTIMADEREVEQRVNQQIDYLIQQVGSEDKLEEAFQSPIRKIRRDLHKDVADRLKIEMLRRKKFQNIKIRRREVEQFFKSYKDSLPALRETVDISHILLQVKAGQSSTEVALQKIEAIKKELETGADFAELARKYSEDPATAKRGGDLGFTERGDFVKEFEEVAFALEENEVSNIVLSQFGFHIIKLIERRGEKIRSSHILIRLQPTDADEQLIVDNLSAIRESILEGDSFDSLAVLYSADENVQNDKGRLGVWEVEKLAIAAFRLEVQKLQPGDISLPFKTDYGYHILKLNKRQQARELTLDKDWEQIQQIALNYKIEKEYVNWIETIKSEVPIEYRHSAN
jgi:peptidyl-prolyl cis-trans isomerase SurA